MRTGSYCLLAGLILMVSSLMILPSNAEEPPAGWQKPLLLENEHEGSSYNVDIAVHDMDDACAIWIQDDGTYDNVMTSVYDKDTGWDVPEVIDTAPNADARFPSIDVGQQGLHHVAVWTQFDGSAYNLYARTRHIGHGWEEAVLLETDETNYVDYPDVSMDIHGSTAIVVWVQNDGTEASIWANRWVRDSGWGTAELIETIDSGSSLYPTVFVNPSGEAVVAWRQFTPSGFTVWANIYVPGVGWGSAERIDTSEPDFLYGPDVVMDDDGNAMVIWSKGALSVYNMFSNRYEAGSGWGTEEPVESYDSTLERDPKIDIDAKGNVIAVWNQLDGSDNNVITNIYSPVEGWKDAEILLENAFDPEISVARSGEAMMVCEWLDNEIYNTAYCRYTPEKGWSFRQPIESRLSLCFSPVVDIGFHGNAISAWIQHDTEAASVWANTYFERDNEPPPIDVFGPQNNVNCSSPVVTVNGTTERLAKVVVNGIVADLSNSGYFQVDVPLYPGSNLISITSTDASGNFKTIMRTVNYTDPVPALLENLSLTETDIIHILENLTRIRDDIESLDSNLTDLSEDLNLTEEDLNILVSDLESLNSTIDSLESLLENEGTRIDSLESGFSETESEIDAASESGTALEEDLSSTEEELESVKMMNTLLIVLMVVVVIVMIVLFIILLNRTSKKKNEKDPFE